jgi:hypothetical protein
MLRQEFEKKATNKRHGKKDSMKQQTAGRTIKKRFPAGIKLLTITVHLSF